MYMYDGVDLVATRFCRIENRTNSDERALLFFFFLSFFSLFLRLDYTCQCFTDPFWGSPTL